MQETPSSFSFSSGDRDATREELETATSAIRAALADAGCAACPVVVNGDVIDAAMAGADGVHLREQAVLRLADSTDLRALVARVRSSLARDGVRRPVVGCSAHSVYSVLVAARAGVDYVQIGTMFPTRTHPDKEDLEGPQLVKDAVAALDDEYVRAPLLVGVGGVTVDNCADVVRAGADGVAVIRSIAESADPKATVAALRTAMTGVSTRGGPASSSSRVKTPTAPPPASPPPPPTAAVSGASPGPPAGRESLLDTR